MIPNCAATRHIHFELDGNGPAKFEKPDLDLWPDIKLPMDTIKRVNIEDLTKRIYLNLNLVILYYYLEKF